MAEPEQKLGIVIKTLKASRHNLQVTLSNNVGDMKKQIETELSLGAAEAMKLIHHGKILKDEQVLNSIGLKEGDFVVLMTTKKRKANKVVKPPENTAPPPETTTAPQPASTQSSTTQPAAANTQQNSANLQQGASALISPNETETYIQNMIGMGFPREDCQRALQAAFNNPDRAVEYLLNGIPANLPAAAPQQQQQQPRQVGAQRGGPGPSQGQGPPSADQIQPRILAALLQNPQMLNAVLMRVQQTNAPLYQTIIQNMQSNPQTAIGAFAQVLNDPQLLQLMLAMALTNGAAPGGSQQQGARPGQQVVELTQQEVAQLGELRAMGFTQDQCVRAYLMADRNVEMAASLLFSQNAFQAAPQAENAQGGPAAPAPVAAANEAQASEAMETEEQNGDDANSGNDNGANPDGTNDDGPESAP